MHERALGKLDGASLAKSKPGIEAVCERVAAQALIQPGDGVLGACHRRHEAFKDGQGRKFVSERHTRRNS